MQSTTERVPRQRRTKNGYEYEALDPTEAKRLAGFHFLPKTAYCVSKDGVVLGIVGYRISWKDWLTDRCLSREGLLCSFGSRERAAVGLRIHAQREGRL